MKRSIKQEINRIQAILSRHERNLKAAEKRIPILKKEKERLENLLKMYPDKVYDKGGVYIHEVDWNNVAGISIDRERGYRHSNTGDFFVKFSLNKNVSNGNKIFMVPQNNKIMSITRDYYPSKSILIKVFDYSDIIPDSCPRKKILLRQIKRYIISKVREKDAELAKDSYDREGFLKYKLL